MLACAVPALAEDRYVIDEAINMRREPATNFPVIRVLKLGEKLQLVESNSSGWDKVRCGDGTEGWVARRATSNKIPVEIERNQLRADLEDLRSKLVAQDKLQHELKRIQEVSRNALKMEQENQDLNAKVSRLEKDLKQASDENRILEKQSDTLFFLAGAGVLLLGFISGLLSRRRRKPSSYGSLD
ncbi:MAG: TIGR04211 family SH3 domain-containing protein [Magnetococcales bacterium]|nr:TIGR04211 family SH3 domain-containing protein [Magnetococcales bacterium]